MSFDSTPPPQPLDTELDAVAPQALRLRRGLEVQKERQEQMLDAVAFLTTPHDDYAGELSRTYDPFATRGDELGFDVTPTPEDDYLATGIGFLYGLNEAPRYAGELVGWTLAGCELVPEAVRA